MSVPGLTLAMNDTLERGRQPILRSSGGPAKPKRSLRFHPSILLLGKRAAAAWATGGHPLKHAPEYRRRHDATDGALEGDLELVKHCLRTHADVNQANEEGLTALHSAACNGHAHIVSYLIACGADVNAVRGEAPPRRDRCTIDRG